MACDELHPPCLSSESYLCCRFKKKFIYLSLSPHQASLALQLVPTKPIARMYLGGPILELLFRDNRTCLFEFKMAKGCINVLENLGNRWDEWPVDKQGFVSIEPGGSDGTNRNDMEPNWYPVGRQKKAQER
jgi:hypothetical protein